MLILVFGTRWHFKSVPGGFEGGLSCPRCKETTPFVEKEAIKAFTLYWWPLVTVERGGRLVECRSCGGKFDLPDELLSGCPRSVREAARAG